MSETIDAPQVDEAAAPAPEADPADDLRAALSSAYDEVSASAPPEEGEADRLRDERGRFARAETDDTPAEPVAAAEQETPADGQQAQAAPQARPALPPEVAAVSSVLEEYKPLYAARGVPPDQAMRALFEAQRVLETRPEEAIQVLARQYGVNLAKFAPQAAPQQPEATQSTDPTIQALYREVETLKGFLSAQQQQTQRAQVDQVQSVINEFAADPKHAHFQAVEPIMAALISSGQAKGLEAAYDMACRAHPEVSRAIQSAEAEARAKTEREARAKAAAEAKAKAVSVRGSAVVNGFAKPPDSVRGVLEAAWDGRLN